MYTCGKARRDERRDGAGALSLALLAERYRGWAGCFAPWIQRRGEGVTCIMKIKPGRSAENQATCTRSYTRTRASLVRLVQFSGLAQYPESADAGSDASCYTRFHIIRERNRRAYSDRSIAMHKYALY